MNFPELNQKTADDSFVPSIQGTSDVASNQFRIGLILFDIITILAAFTAAYMIRQYLALPPVQHITFYRWFVIITAGGFLLFSYCFDLYSKKNMPLSLLSLSDFMMASFLWSASIMAFSYIAKEGYSRFIVMLFLFLTIAFAYIIRLCIAQRIATIIPYERIKERDPRMFEEVRYLKHLTHIPHAHNILAYRLDIYRRHNIISAAMKRMVDIAIALIGLIIVCPFIPLLFWWITSDTPGPFIIAQQRIKKGGHVFMLYKIRTMKHDTQRYALAPRSGNDSRITSAGRLLRKYSIDELPQLWNVLRGDMSIVGPRPEMPFIVKQYSPVESLRLTVKPGITGIWQIFGRKDLPLEENIEYDLYYILHQSFFLDIAILLKTIPHLILPHGAY